MYTKIFPLSSFITSSFFVLITRLCICVQVPGQYGPVRTLAVAGDIVLAGTTKNALVQSSLVSPSFTAITEGHTDELWGIASHPNQLQFVTAGNDGVLYLWDALAHVTIAVNELLVS